MSYIALWLIRIINRCFKGWQDCRQVAAEDNGFNRIFGLHYHEGMKTVVNSRILMPLILFILLTVNFLAPAQEKYDQAGLWLNPARNGDAQKLGAYLDELVALELPSATGNFSKSHTIMLTRDFFENWPADSIVIRQQGNTGSKSRFYIGDYYSKSVSYYIYVVVNQKNGNDLIHVFNIKKK